MDFIFSELFQVLSLYCIQSFSEKLPIVCCFNVRLDPKYIMTEGFRTISHGECPVELSSSVSTNKNAVLFYQSQVSTFNSGTESTIQIHSFSISASSSSKFSSHCLIRGLRNTVLKTIVNFEL